MDAHGAERAETAGEDRVPGEGVLEEGLGDRRYAVAGQFAQEGDGEVVGDAGGPFVDRVERGRGDDHGSACGRAFGSLGMR